MTAYPARAVGVGGIGGIGCGSGMGTVGGSDGPGRGTGCGKGFGGFGTSPMAARTPNSLRNVLITERPRIAAIRTRLSFSERSLC